MKTIAAIWAEAKRRRRILRRRLWRIEALLFPSPAEAAFAKLIGAWVITLPIYPRWRPESERWAMRIIVPMGWYRGTYIEREVAVRGYRIDFANRALKRGVEIDGRAYHDVVADIERDNNLAKSGWRVLRIPAGWVLPYSTEYNPAKVLRRVRGWLD